MCPPEHFTISEPRNPLNDGSGRYKVHQSADFEALKL